MEFSDHETVDETVVHKYRLSWMAYVRSVLAFLLFVLLSFALSSVHSVLFILVLLTLITLFVIRMLTLRSVALFVDDKGVWLYRGIFPWNKGFIGVKWRDIEDAVYFSGFTSWVLKSYSVRVGHRFTKSSEIVIGHLKDGDKAVLLINEIHQQKISAS